MPNPNLPINFRKNTYIGARYVPKFADTPASVWDNSIQYEPLTIVVYQGNSYTSKTFVPVGVDINNTTYWANTGNYNAQVESYREEVKEVENKIDKLENKVLPFIDIVKKDVIKKYIFIGDSYQSGYFNGSEGAVSSFLDVALELLSLPPETYWRAEANGYGFVGNNNRTFLSLIQTLESRIADKNAINNIVIEGGLNDLGKDIYTNASEVMNYIKSNYPNAKVYLVFMGQRLTDNEPLDYQTTITRYKALESIGYNWVNGFLDVIKNKNRYFSPIDNQHPTQQGQNILGQAFASWIKTGTVPFLSQTQNLSVTKTSAIGATSLVPNWYQFFFSEGVLLKSSGYIQIKFDTPHTLTYNEEIIFATFNGACPIMSNKYNVTTFIFSSIDLPSQNMFGRLYITGNNIMFNYISPTQTNTVNSITIPNIDIILPSTLA